jgi:hypothetical protein
MPIGSKYKNIERLAFGRIVKMLELELVSNKSKKTIMKWRLESWMFTV